ncbi:hypothetical protein PV396_23240 [Streptomyces sp. ME02-8801-2C]|nr:hypothetical protein [Streptomyces sp. ME02-8801-2C]MDX3454820.1 hypothetical protein [Streptomyces sp. ME02-8801-2C]
MPYTYGGRTAWYVATRPEPEILAALMERIRQEAGVRPECEAPGRSRWCGAVSRTPTGHVRHPAPAAPHRGCPSHCRTAVEPPTRP